MSIRHLYQIAVLAIVSTTVEAQVVPWPVSSGGNGHSYEVVLASPQVDWATARFQAQAKGGDLASITSAAENDFVFQLIALEPALWKVVGQDTRGPWIGGFQPPSAPEPLGDWMWVSGEAFSYANWAAGEPNEAGGEDHLHFHGKGQGNCAPTWNDLSGGAVLPGYVIEYPSTPSCTKYFGSSVNLDAFECLTPPQLGTSWVSQVGLEPGSLLGGLALGFGGWTSIPFGQQEILVLPPYFVVATVTGQLSLAIPATPGLSGLTVSSQGFRLDTTPQGIELTLMNGIELQL